MIWSVGTERIFDLTSKLSMRDVLYSAAVWYSQNNNLTVYFCSQFILFMVFDIFQDVNVQLPSIHDLCNMFSNTDFSSHVHTVSANSNWKCKTVTSTRLCPPMVSLLYKVGLVLKRRRRKKCIS